MNKKRADAQIEKRKAKAQEILSDTAKANKFAEDVENKYKKSVKNKKSNFFTKYFSQLQEYVPLFVSLMKSYVKGEYREIPLGTILAVVATLLYFFSPIDIIPDFIPGVGMVDDASLIGIVILSIKADLDDYKMWKSFNENIIDVEPN